MPLSQELTVIHRLLRIIVLLQGPGPWGRQGLAETLGADIRTVSRDLKRLEAGGVPVEYDKVEQTYRLRHGFYMPPVTLSVTEAVAISVLTGSPAATGNFLAGPAAQAAEKFRAGLPELLREELGSVLPAITIDPARSEAGDVADDVWFKVSRAIADRRGLAYRYDAILTPEERSRLLKLGEEVNHEVDGLIDLVNVKTYRRWLSDKAQGKPARQVGRRRTITPSVHELIVRMAKDNHL